MSEIYSNSPVPAIPPSPYQVAVNRKDEEIRSLKEKLQAALVSNSDLETELQTKTQRLDQKEKVIKQLKEGRERLRKQFEQDLESAKSEFQAKRESQASEIKRLQEKTESCHNQREQLHCLEKEKENLIKENERLMNKINSLGQVGHENEYLTDLVEHQKRIIKALEENMLHRTEELKEYGSMKEMYEQKIQQLHTKHTEELELIEQQKFNRLDVSGEILSEVCVEKQIQELQIELDDMLARKDAEIIQLKEKSEENINLLKSQLDEMTINRESELKALDEVILMYQTMINNLVSEVKRCSSTVVDLALTVTSLEETYIHKTAKLELENNIKTEQMKVQQKEITNWKQNAHTLLDENKNFANKIKQLEQHIQTTVAKLESQLTETEERENNFKLQVQTLNEDLSKEKENISEWRQKFAELERNFEDFQKLREDQLNNLRAENVFLQNNVSNLIGITERIEIEKKERDEELTKTAEFLERVTERADLDHTESETLRMVVQFEMELASYKLNLLESHIQQFQKSETLWMETASKLDIKLSEKIQENEKLEIEFESVKKALKKMEELKCQEVEKLLTDVEDVKKERDEVLRDKRTVERERNALSTKIMDKENFLSQVLTKLKEIEMERNVNEDLEYIVNLNLSLSQLEEAVKTAEKSEKEFINKAQVLEENLRAKESEVCKMKCDLLLSNKKLELIENTKSTEILSLSKEKESLQKEVRECELKLGEIGAKKSKLDEENRQLTINVSDYEDKLSSLKLEVTELKSENHTLGLKYEVEISDKLQYYKSLWEKEKLSLLAENGTLQREVEKCKTTLSDRLKQEELKYNVLKDQFQNAKRNFEQLRTDLDRSHSPDVFAELVEKVELYKRHYEDMKNKNCETSESLAQEKKNRETLQVRLAAYQKVNTRYEREITQLRAQPKIMISSPSSTREHKTLTVYSGHNLDERHNVESKAIPIYQHSHISDTFYDSLNDSHYSKIEHSPSRLNTTTSSMASFQSGDHKMEYKRMGHFKPQIDEEEENEWDLKYVKALKDGTCEAPNGRLTELQRRNTLCLPHLKTTYPVETQMCSQIPFEEDAFQKGKAVLEDFKIGDSAANSSSSPKPRKVKATEPVYRKPGPPTPGKNLALALSKTSIKTPSSLKRLLGARRSFKPNARQPVAFEMGFSPVKPKGAKRRIATSPPKNETHSGFLTNKLRIFSKGFGNKKDESFVSKF